MKFLNETGLQYLWSKIKGYITTQNGNYLPLSGGTISGALTVNGLLTATKNISTTAILHSTTASQHENYFWATNGETKMIGTICGKSVVGSNITLSKGDVGLGNVDNTSDANKPVSTAVQSALNGKVSNTVTVNGHALTSNVTVTKSDIGLGNVTNDSQVKRSELGAPNGVPMLNDSGVIDSIYLPSYVDDVLVYDGNGSGKGSNISISDVDKVLYNTEENVFFGIKGTDTCNNWESVNGDEDLGRSHWGPSVNGGVKPAKGKIYINSTDNNQYRYNGTGLTQVSKSISLGTTSSTAFRGDYGQLAYTHAVTNKGKAFSSGLYKVTVNAEGHVTEATAVTKSDITALGIPGQDTHYTLPTASSSVLGGIKLGYSASNKNYPVAVDSNGNAYVNVPWSDTVTSNMQWSAITNKPTIITALETGKKYAKFVEADENVLTVSFDDTTGSSPVTATTRISFATVGGKSIIGTSGNIDVANTPITNAEIDAIIK